MPQLGWGRSELKSIEALAIDTATLIVEFASGDIGSMTVSWGLPPGVQGPAGACILGPKGVMIPGGTRVEIRKENRETTIREFEAVDLDFALVSNFARAVDTRQNPQILPRDGLMTLAMSLAALRSIETGQAVRIDEILGDIGEAGSAG